MYGGASSPPRAGVRPAVGVRPRLTVIVVNWNGRDLLDDCLASLLDGGYRPLHIILVDNGSTDDSVAHVRQHYPSVEVIVSAENLRWAGGNNLALRHLRDTVGDDDLLLLLNNDTIVPEGSLERLVDAVRAEPRAWIATPRICYAEDPALAWYDGGVAGRWSGWIRHQGIRRLTGLLPLDERFVDWGTGCALLLTRQALRELGELDEDFYFYGEDTDYCFRAREAGGRILHVPRALVLHKVSAALGALSPQKAYLRSRSHIILLRRHWPVRLRPVLAVTQVAFYAGHAVWHLWHGRSTTALALVEGVLDELRGAPVRSDLG